jgi:nicotinamide phosphoribosyltransferase
MKATSAVITRERHTIFKDPITSDGSKKSAKGLLMVDRDSETEQFKLHEDVSEETEKLGFLKTVFEYGTLVKSMKLSEIRNNLMIELKHFS